MCDHEILRNRLTIKRNWCDDAARSASDRSFDGHKFHQSLNSLEHCFLVLSHWRTPKLPNLRFWDIANGYQFVQDTVTCARTHTNTYRQISVNKYPYFCSDWTEIINVIVVLKRCLGLLFPTLIISIITAGPVQKLDHRVLCANLTTRSFFFNCSLTVRMKQNNEIRRFYLRCFVFLFISHHRNKLNFFFSASGENRKEKSMLSRRLSPATCKRAVKWTIRACCKSCKDIF